MSDHYNCKYFAYRCHYYVKAGEKYCDYHKWLVGVLQSLSGSAGILLLMAILSSILPSLSAYIGVAGLITIGLWIYRSVEKP